MGLGLARFFKRTSADDALNAKTLLAIHSAANYTPVQTGTEGADKISAHFKGVDTALASAGGNTVIYESATNLSGTINKNVVVKGVLTLTGHTTINGFLYVQGVINNNDLGSWSLTVNGDCITHGDIRLYRTAGSSGHLNVKGNLVCSSATSVYTIDLKGTGSGAAPSAGQLNVGGNVVCSRITSTGSFSTTGAGGGGGPVYIKGNLVCTVAGVETGGGGSNAGAGGNAGTVQVLGGIVSKGTIQANGGTSSFGAGGNGGALIVQGSLVSQSVYTYGGNSSGVAGANAGDVTINGKVTLLEASADINAYGGTGTSAGISGTVTLYGGVTASSINNYSNPGTVKHIYLGGTCNIGQIKANTDIVLGSGAPGTIVLRAFSSGSSKLIVNESATTLIDSAAAGSYLWDGVAIKPGGILTGDLHWEGTINGDLIVKDGVWSFSVATTVYGNVTLVGTANIAATSSPTLTVHGKFSGNIEDADLGTLVVKGEQYKTVTSTFTAVAYDKLLADTAGGAFTITLPASPSVGDLIEIYDQTTNWATANLTIDPNSLKINGSTANLVLSGEFSGGKFIYCGTTSGWVTDLVQAETTILHSTTFSCGGATSGSYDVRLTKIGRTVTMVLPLYWFTTGGTGANKVTMDTALPAAYRSTSNNGYRPATFCGLYDNGSYVSAEGSVETLASGVVEIYLRPGHSGTYTTSAATGLALPVTLRWLVD